MSNSGSGLSVAPAGPRCGFVAVIGAPNVGKSTLVNALVGAKVTIVTPKVQTTRAIMRGIAIEGDAQLIFVDTPGIFSPRRRLDRAMVATAWSGAHDADIVALMVLIAALSGNGVAEVKAWLAAHVPEGPWHYPEDQITDAPLRALAAEITREKIYLRLHQELPYHSTVETESWQERKDGSVRIEQTIYVERESQRKIVLGKGGQAIKSIGAQARKEIAEILERPVHLFLFVKVREGWSEDPERYREMGLEFPKD